jgi:hypothetical protein
LGLVNLTLERSAESGEVERWRGGEVERESLRGISSLRFEN